MAAEWINIWISASHIQEQIYEWRSPYSRMDSPNEFIVPTYIANEGPISFHLLVWSTGNNEGISA